MIIIQVNVLKSEQGIIKGSPPDPGCDFVSRIGQKCEFKNGVILLSLKNGLGRKNPKQKLKNVNKLLKRLLVQLCNLLMSESTEDDESEISKIYCSNLVKKFTASSFIKLKNVFESVIKLVEDKFNISTAKMLSLTIYITLLRQNVESNPGMKLDKEETFAALTYNCNGLGDKKKLKRLTNKLSPMVDKGAIIFLQETHLIDTSYLKLIWKNKLESNCIRTNSAGVIILYNNNLDLIICNKDNEGRHLSIVVQNQDKKLILANSYFPNDHKAGIVFAEKIYLTILELQHKYPDHLTIAAGDYNVCMKINDSINRLRSTSEKLLSETIESNNKITNLVDAYRSIHKEGGFTWRRGSCYSRLDYIFISNSLLQQIHNAKHDWSFESSDHAAVMITFSEKNLPRKGPGIVKVNTEILNNPIVSKQIEEEIIAMMSQTDNSWNPHKKLEFFKVAIRSVFSVKVWELRKNLTNNIAEIEEETNQMEDLKISIVDSCNVSQPEVLNKINAVDSAICSLKAKLVQLREKLSNKLAFQSKAKWFEYGEKSNKFFLNLLKSKQNQKLIGKINNGNKTYNGEMVMGGIREFYKDLYTADPGTYQNDESYYENCPKLTNEQLASVDSNLTICDLLKALKSCKDSSPGPDGIPYLVYLKFWKIAGPIILDAWNFSVENKILPPSHYESVITLLPKEGKDTRDIKNWRPITLSNCDAKIITKALSNKISGVLDSIIDPSQTAYVPGRSVADNLRTNLFLKKYCKQNNVKSVLISLDAKKAFDSVNHRYIEDTLRAYNFGEGFIGIFKLLYSDITAKILVNGFLSESIKIERGVKQGDALSCAIFIICIDPLLRNINKSKVIQAIDIKFGREKICFKGGAFADDISVICKNDITSIQGVFNEYNRLTCRSGLQLNADKTEILNLNDTNQNQYSIKYNQQNVVINTVTKLKICGIYYCNDSDEEYNHNVLDKINKLSQKIKQWIPRQLTTEGKVLITKTFGLSQLIYNMQSYEFREVDLKNAERLIFQFIWSNKENHKGIDRISRAIMKNGYEQGGMKVTDVECLDRSVKLKQYIRAQRSKHIISKIQCLITDSQNNGIKQEYAKLTDKEAIVRSAQQTLNIITDYNREAYKNLNSDEIETDKNLIDEISSINLKTFLTRKNKPFILCILKQVNDSGITTLADLVQAEEHVKDNNLAKSIKLVLSAIPKYLIEIAKNYNENINDDCENLKYILITPSDRMAIDTITVKQLQITLKVALKRIEATNFKVRLGIDNFVTEHILTFRSNCKNSKLRNIYFRLINRDFFTHSRMKKYKMTNTDECPRCGQTETISHLLWECAHVKDIWNIYNKFINKLGDEQNVVKDYESVYFFGQNSVGILIKIKVIQALIQIERPKHWNDSTIEKLVKELIDNERYIAYKKYSLGKFLSKWDIKE